METEDGKIFTEYRRCSNQLRRLTRKATKLYEQNISKQAKGNPKAFWRYVGSKTNMKSKIPDLYATDDNNPDLMTKDDKGKADRLGDFFSSVFTNEPDGGWNLPNKPEIKHKLKLLLTHVTEENLAKKLKKLKISKSPGPDGIHPRVINELKDTLVKPLLIIFQTSVRTSTVPSAWKDAAISAIHKKGDRHAAGNYRPVSLTSIACKILESFIRDAIIRYMRENGLISRKQFGFLTGRSTVLQLLKVIDSWTEILDRGGCVDVIYCDFMKAFDTVPHHRLINVLEYYGIDDPILSWIKDFLTDRRQKVVINGVASKWHQVTSGIPQGSVLGPVLFVVYINTMVEESGVSDVYLYADDTKIFNEIHCQQDIDDLQQDLNRLFNWTKESLLKFHPDKCVSMRIGTKPDLRAEYSMDDKILSSSTEEKDLGVFIDSKLSFDKHISTKVTKATTLVNLIRRSFEYLDKGMFKMLFTSIVRPHLEYANSVWNPHLQKHITALENVQRRASKLIPGMRDLSYEARLRSVGLPTLAYRRYRGDMIEMFKLTHGLYDTQVVEDFLDLKPSRARGHKYNVYKRGCRLNVRKFSFKLRVTDQWNNLPEHVVTATSLNCFKARLDKWWKGSDIMFNPDTKIHEVTSARSSRGAHHTVDESEDDLDLMPEA